MALMKLIIPFLAILSLAGCQYQHKHGEDEVDWKEKFIREVNYHYETQQRLQGEVAARNLEIENYKNFIKILEESAGAQVKANDPNAVTMKRLEAKVDALQKIIDLLQKNVADLEKRSQKH